MRILFVVIIVFTSSFVFGQHADSTQMDLIDVLIRKKNRTSTDKIRSTKKVHFSVLPAAVNVPGGGKAVITAANAAFYIGDPNVTNLSNVYIIPYTNLDNRYGLYIRPNLWLAKNSFNILGDYRIAHFPQYSWGVGGGTPEWDRSLIDADYFRFYQTAFKKIQQQWYGGLGYVLDHYYNIDETEFVGKGHLDRYDDEEYTSTISSGITFNVKYDGRENAINPQQGSYLLVTWRWNAEALGSTFTNHSIFADARKYIKANKFRDHILAFRSYYWTMISGKTPYLDLPATNWAPSMGISSRGFQSGRYRSNAMIYFEGEQRVQLTNNGLIGLVAFMNVASTSEFETQNFQDWQVGGGVGLRAKFNKYSNTNVAIDFGFSQNYWGVWLNIGEVF